MNPEDAKAARKEILRTRRYECEEVPIWDLTVKDAHCAPKELVLIADSDKRRTVDEKVAEIEKQRGACGSNGRGDTERSAGNVSVHGFLHSETVLVRND